MRAIGAKFANERLFRNDAPALEKEFRKSDEKAIEKMEKLFRSAFYLVKK